MVSRLGSWWKKIKQHWVAIVVVAIVLVVVIVLVVIGYKFSWIGFSGYNKVSTVTEIASSPPKITRTEEYQPGKTLWDWLQLLIIPLALAVIALLFKLANSRTEQKISLDKQRQDLLQTYLDRMAELLLEKQLGTSASEEVRNVARVRTITVLTQLDARRIGHVFAFLREAGLMSTTSSDNVVRMSKADLRAVNWSQADLREANLREANLREADLSHTNLSFANLREADLSFGNLREADFSGANLLRANLSGAKLSHTNFKFANLSYANLSQADLSRANLGGTSLVQTDLSSAKLSQADLSGANLRGAIGITNEEMGKQAKSLKGAIMPDGSKHPQ
jgi:uncharacterized protein YjbI with pentapeptide repeats